MLMMINAGLDQFALSSHSGTTKAEPSAPVVKVKTRQQVKMAACNKDAKQKTLKGDERKKFMSSCLSA